MPNNFLKLIEENLLEVKLFRWVNEYGSCCLLREQFGVEFNSVKWKRKSCEELERQIEKIWQEKCIQSKVYNGKKFRFGGINLISNKKINLNLGLTCYRDIVGTSQAADAGYWRQKGKEETGNSHVYMSDGLGVGILAFTNDKHLMLTRRAEWTGEYPGMLDRPGGHPEPDNVFLPDGSLKDKNYNNNNNVAVAEEVWNSSIQELEDETGISKRQIEDQKFMGVVVNSVLAGRPSLEFFTNVRASAEEIRQQYSLNKHSEADESTSLLLIPPDKLRLLLANVRQKTKGIAPVESDSNVSQMQYVEEILNESTPALKGALALYEALNK